VTATDPWPPPQFHAEVTSTNDLAMQLALRGAPEGSAVLAGRQTAGRGRFGREWFSPADAGLYLSVVARPDRATRSWSLLTLAAGVAAAEAVEIATGLRCDLKWPNDIVIGRPWRKLGGVLCESAERAVVIGIGLNLRAAAYPPDIADRATAIEVELGREIESSALSATLMRSLQDALAQLRAGGHDRICEAWRTRARSGLGGRVVRWREQGHERRGRARDIDANGALLVEAEGQVVRVIAGEVTWEPWTRE